MLGDKIPEVNVGSCEEADNVGHDFGRAPAVKAGVLSKYKAVGEKQDFQNQTSKQKPSTYFVSTN
jgi:hypothetical protein